MQQQIPPHLAPFEKAARIYCERAGLDADAVGQMPHPLIKGAVITSPPQWTEVAERLLDLSMLLSSMKAAQAQESVIVP